MKAHLDSPLGKLTRRPQCTATPSRRLKACGLRKINLVREESRVPLSRPVGASGGADEVQFRHLASRFKGGDLLLVPVRKFVMRGANRGVPGRTFGRLLFRQALPVVCEILVHAATPRNANRATRMLRLACAS